MSNVRQISVEVTVEHPGEPGTEIAMADIMALHTHKHLSQPDGSFQMTMRHQMSNGTPWERVVRPNDLISISIGIDGQSQTVMLGLVDSAHYATKIGENGAHVMSYEVSGRDLAKLLTSFNISNSFLIDESNKYSAANLVFQNTAFGDHMDVPGMVRSLFGALNNLKKPSLKFARWGSASWLDQIQYANTVKSPYQVQGSVPIMYSGPVWGLLKEIASPPFHELFLDTYGGNAILTIRPTPYSTLATLPATEILGEHWVAREMGYSDQEVINVVFVVHRFFEQSQSIYPPIYSEESLNLFGVREQTIRTNLVPMEYVQSKATVNADPKDLEAQKAACLKMASPLASQIVTWYHRADRYKCGYAVVRGNPALRIGTCAIMADRKERYYVEGVRHALTLGEQPSFQTTLTLTRGERIDATPDTVKLSTGQGTSIAAPAAPPVTTGPTAPPSAADSKHNSASDWDKTINP